MMQLSLQTFTSLVQGMAAAVQAAAAQLLDLTVGSTLRAILEATASLALWMQWLILQVLQMTRAATSNGADLDSWMADFSLTRLPASSASGTVTFSRFNSSVPALVPVGAVARTTDGTQTFAVTEDATAPGWNQAQNGYVIGIGVTSLDVPVVAQAAGTSGNVQAAAITVLASALSGIDSVLNAAPLVNGMNAESDSAFRLRFQSFMASLSRATLAAVGYALTTVQQGLSYTIQENQNPSGAFQLGNFIIVVDDGSGYPSNALLSMVQQAVEVIRPVGSTFAVFAATVTQVNVSLTITATNGANVILLTSQIVNAIGTYINALPVGAPLPATMIALITYTACPNISNVTSILLNGQASDIVVQLSGVIKTGTVVVS
jgi:uncharacterized phage protein gp47/JayE